MASKTTTTFPNKPLSMRVTYKMKNVCKKIPLLLLPLFLAACETFTQGQAQTSVESPAEPLQQQSAQVAEKQDDKPCICEQPQIKEVIRYIDKPCPLAGQQKTTTKAKKTSKAYGDKMVVGRVEYVVLSANGLPIKARVDTGAKTSSLNALDMVEFERDGKKWVRFAVMNPATEEKVYFERKVQRYVRIKQMETDFQRRPVVKMGVQLGSVDEFVELTLTDRSDYVYQVLVGRNFLLDRMVVDVSQKYIAQSQTK